MARRTGLHSTSRSLAALVLSVVVIPATVLVVAVAERERIPVAAAPIASIPPLPAAPSDRAEGLALEALPIVEGSTDAAGAAFLDRYEELDLADSDAAVDIVLAAWDPLAFGSMGELITRTTLDEETANNLPSGQERASLEKAAREELQADPNHARHLNDLAIALFALGVRPRTTNSANRSGNSPAEATLGSLPTICFGSGSQAFPDDRALTLNLALLASASPGYLTEFEAELDPSRRLPRLWTGTLTTSRHGSCWLISRAWATPTRTSSGRSEHSIRWPALRPSSRSPGWRGVTRCWPMPRPG